MADPYRLSVDGTALNRDGGALADESDDLVGDLANLARTLTDLGEAWGDDELGASFGPAYLGFVEHVVSAVVTYGDQIAGTGVALPAGGATIVDEDRSQGDRAASIVRPTGEPAQF
ncbi:hypothetical protein [Virgisporangium ochraceum]|uniref:Uncharacterized protein n=1 Tax=Virgisporangium ochraceum TaxID=65505 RepID=A0A8J3ZUY1_9ACTN|nr:hypothetical protein [Virgisporangium ochraceum]GIJ70394.1 hypothetical protein Voc01_053110 [Virgisporangium ochraceum]